MAAEASDGDAPADDKSIGERCMLGSDERNGLT